MQLQIKGGGYSFDTYMFVSLLKLEACPADQPDIRQQ